MINNAVVDIKNPLNPFALMSASDLDYDTHTLVYNRTLEILDEWEPLFRRERRIFDNGSYVLLKEAVINKVLDDFNGDLSSIDAYIKKIALTVRFNSGVSSINRIISNSHDGNFTLEDTLTDDNRIEPVYSKDEIKRRVSEELFWSEWVHQLETKDLSLYDFTVMDVTQIIFSVPILERVLQYHAEEIIQSEVGTLKRDFYKTCFNTIVNQLKVNLKLTTSEVHENISNWLALFLQNREVFRTQYALVLQSHVLPFKNTKESKVSIDSSIDFTLKDDYINFNGKRKSRIYKFNLGKAIDFIFDDYYSEHSSNLSFKVNGRTFYNVLGGIFVEDGDLIPLLRENLCELVLLTLKAKFICMTDEYLYVEVGNMQPSIQFYIYYFGLTLPFVLLNVGRSCAIEGDIIHDITQFE